jgi:membrane-bound lytic murein transglycosylase
MIIRSRRRISAVIPFQCLLVVVLLSCFLLQSTVGGTPSRTRRRSIDLLSTKAILHQHQRRLQQKQQQHASNRTRDRSRRQLNVLNCHLHEAQSTRHLSRYEIQFRKSHGINLQLDWNGDYEHFIDVHEEDDDDDDDFVEEWMAVATDSYPPEKEALIQQQRGDDCSPNCTETTRITDNHHHDHDRHGGDPRPQKQQHQYRKRAVNIIAIKQSL